MSNRTSTSGVLQAQPDKREVAASFSRAACSYDQMAGLQRKLGQQLLSAVSDKLSGHILDLGSGTGYFTGQLASSASVVQVYGLDMALGMLHYARQHRPDPKVCWTAGDAESLPLCAQSMDVVFANLSIQWCQQLETLCAELFRVLKPRGILAFTTLGPDTLWQLRDAWRTIDNHQHVNRFQSREALTEHLAQGFQQLSFQQWEECLLYPELQPLLAELKGIGAQNRNPGRPLGLSGRQRLRQLQASYESYRTEAGLIPASYEVYLGVYQKHQEQ